MKNLFKFAVEFKALLSLFFTGEIIVYMFFAYISGHNSMSFVLLLQLLAIAGVVTIFQFFLDSEIVFLKNMHVIVKTIVHYFALGIVLIAFCMLFGWLPSGYAVFSFVQIYTAAFIVFSFVFLLYYKVTGEKFNEKLYSYKSKNIK